MKLITAVFFCGVISSCGRHYGSGESVSWTMPQYGELCPPGFVLIEGGSFETDSGGVSKTIQLKSFYISQYEETNAQYLAWLNFLQRYYSYDTYVAALPDTNVWRAENLSKEEQDFMVNHYLRDPQFSNYPVVGVSPNQVKRYARWKTDRLNEYSLRESGLIGKNCFASDSGNVFTTTAFLQEGSYWHCDEPELVSLDGYEGELRVRFEDYLIFPPYRLPTALEWQIAMLAQGDENNTYLETSCDVKIRSTDPFGFLAAPVARSKVVALPGVLHSLGPVNQQPVNNYLLHGLTGGVSEIVSDSSGNYIIGGSWKKPVDAYDDERKILVSPGFFEVGNVGARQSSACHGFRLVMPCTYEVPANAPRRKGK